MCLGQRTLTFLLWEMGKPLGVCPLSHPLAACLPSGWTILLSLVQSPPSLQPPLAVQHLVDLFSQWPSGKAFWPSTEEEAGLGQKRKYSGVPEASCVFFMSLYRWNSIGVILKS